jgi:glycine/D-amino acid oxidase-like deaminating enzyme
MIDTVSEVERVVTAEGIDCDFVRGGTLSFVRTAPQQRRADAELAEAAEYGVDALSRQDVSATPGVAGITDVVFDPACARIQPAKLVRGLARVVESRGVRILERSPVTGIDTGVLTVRGEAGTHVVRASSIVVATEAWGMPGGPDRSIMPLYSLMIATEPLSDDIWDGIGIRHGQTFADYRHLLIYGQRTADNRIAFGGRGARYHLASAIRPEYDRVPAVIEHLRTVLAELIPAAAGTPISHAWGGPLGVPRDWHSGVRFDEGSRVWRAGGYVGDGVGTSNLAGRTLAAMITGRDADLNQLPLAGHRSRRWEVEPLRFLGANAGLLAMGYADTEERLTGRPSMIARLAAPIIGH